MTDIRCDQPKELCERLKLEAQAHAQEARTSNATIAEIYQVVTGTTGELGNWHGAQPVKEAIDKLKADYRALSEAHARELAGWEAAHIALDRELQQATARAARLRAALEVIAGETSYLSDAEAVARQALEESR